MSTIIRNSLSKKNKYYISKHRYLELKHFCLQYSEWKLELQCISGLANGDIYDPTSDAAIRASALEGKMHMVEKAAEECDPYIGKYIFQAVTQDLTYTYFQTVKHIPCGRDMYYDRYRRFFYILSLDKHSL